MTYTLGEQLSRKLEWDEIKVGDKSTLTHHLTLEDVHAFAALTGDFNPLHLDESFARKTPFRKPVAYGMLSASFISTMIGMLLPGEGSLWTAQTLEFLSPAFIGDTLNLTAWIRHKSPATRAVILEIVIANQNAQKLITGQATVKLLELQDMDTRMNNDTSKIVLITGGTGGIGAATARRLAAAGHAIVVNYQNSAERAQELVDEIVQAGGRAMMVKANITQTEDVQQLVSTVSETLGGIQALVHCAAPRSQLQPFDNLEWTEIQQQLDVQIKGAFNCVKAVLPGMLLAQAGSMVLLGSIVADGVPPTQQADYVIAKSALSGLARSLAAEYGPRGLRVNVVAPGMTQTEMISNLPEKAKLLTRMQTPLRRLAEPEDIAGIIEFLLSPGALHITGETIRVCGGVVML